MRLSAIVALAVSIISTAQVEAGLVIAKSAVNPTNGHTYHLLHGDGVSQVGLSWTEAETEAVRLGGHLVAINDAIEQQWIVYTFPGQLGPNDVSEWNPGEPNNFGGDEDYVHLYNFAGGAFEWNDAPDVRLFPSSGGPMSALVEVVPEPSSLVGVGVVSLLRSVERVAAA